MSNPSLPEPQAPPVTVVALPRKDLRTAVEDVFHELGGADGMIEWVRESTANRRIFYKDILPKLVPKQVQGEFSGPKGGPIRMVVEWADGTGTVQNDQPAAMVMNAITQSFDDDE